MLCNNKIASFVSLYCSEHECAAYNCYNEKMWGSDYSSEDYRSYIYSVDTATLRRGLSPDAVVLYAEELSFLSSTVKNKILKTIQEEK
jgi:hypothetical protein